MTSRSGVDAALFQLVDILQTVAAAVVGVRLGYFAKQRGSIVDRAHRKFCILQVAAIFPQLGWVDQVGRGYWAATAEIARAFDFYRHRSLAGGQDVADTFQHPLAQPSATPKRARSPRPIHPSRPQRVEPRDAENLVES